MKYSVALIAASAAAASAQFVYNQTSGTFTCPGAAANSSFCAGDSLQTNIIIRCTNGIGQPGNCNDNLAGQPPVGVNFAPCYQTSPTAGDAACSKNCIVYSPSGSFPVPGCVPNNGNTTTTTIRPPPLTTYPTGGSTIRPPPSNVTTTTEPTTPVTIITTSTLPNGSPTVVTLTTAAPPTKTPVGPATTTNTGPIFTGAADRHSVGALVGAIGIAAAFIF